MKPTVLRRMSKIRFDYRRRNLRSPRGGVCRQQRTCVQWLIDQGVLLIRMSAKRQSYHLTREGGHSHRRISCADATTGKEVETTLVSRAQNHPNIQVLEQQRR